MHVTHFEAVVCRCYNIIKSMPRHTLQTLSGIGLQQHFDTLKTHCCDFHFGRCVLGNLADHVESPIGISEGHIVPRRNLLTCNIVINLLILPFKFTVHCRVVHIQL